MIRRAGVLGVALLIASPAAADWLVMRDGTRMETRGPWTVKGQQVVFTRPNGSLAALRKADVDLEASAAATRESQGSEPAAGESTGESPRPKRSPVLVLTNDDIAKAADPEEPAEAADSETEESEEDEAAPVNPVSLVSWGSREGDDLDGLEIYGSVENASDDIAAGIRVVVTVRDEDGEPLFDSRAFLKSTGLAPGQSTTFRTLLPGIYHLAADPTFEVLSEGITVQGKKPPAGSGEDEVGEEGGDEEPPAEG